MKSIFTFTLLSISLGLFVPKSNAECAVDINTNISSITPGSCNGILRVTNGATVTIDGHTN